MNLQIDCDQVHLESAKPRDARLAKGHVARHVALPVIHCKVRAHLARAALKSGDGATAYLNFEAGIGELGVGALNR